MTTATAESNLMGLGMPAPLARLMVEGPIEFNGTDQTRVTGAIMQTRSVTAMTTSATIATAAILGGIITANQGAAGAATYTMPTGTVFAAAVPAAMATGDCILFSIVNISTNAAEIVTVAGDTDMTAVGNMTIAANGATTSQAWGTFMIRKTGATTFSFYRVG